MSTPSDPPTELIPSQVFNSLCKKCQGASSIFKNSYLSFDAPDTFEHHGTFLSLQAAADAGCHLCQTIWQHIVWDNQMIEPFPDLSLRNWRFKGGIEVELQDVSPPSGALNCFEKPFLEGILDSELPPPVTSGKTQVDFYPWPRDGFLKMDPIPIKRSMPGSNNEDLKELIRTEILPWIQDCQAQHPDCSPSEAIVVPTRLIDVSVDGAEVVKLIKTDQNDLSIEFLTLSYCWGKGTGNSKARTTWANLQSRLDGICIKDLPATIRDAITITRLMGVKYLWVDAMCIVQPSGPNDQGDWATEAGRMGDYYAGSLCCIAASCANASTEGFLRPRSFSRYDIERAIFPFTEDGLQGLLWYRMAAISGVASLLSRKYQDEYFYGVFRSGLAQGLLWSSIGKPGELGKFPSWSWLSSVSEFGDVYFPNMTMTMARFEETGTSLIREVLSNPFPKTNDLYPTSRSDQALEIEAPLIEIKLTEKLVSSHGSVIPDDSPIFAGWGCTYWGVPMEGKLCEDGGIVYYVLLLLGGREYNGLVLKKKTEKEWERVDVITIRSDDKTAVQCVDGFIRKVVLV